MNGTPLRVKNKPGSPVTPTTSKMIGPELPKIQENDLGGYEQEVENNDVSNRTGQETHHCTGEPEFEESKVSFAPLLVCIQL